MNLLRLVSISFGLALLCAFTIRILGRQVEASAQDHKIDEICAVVTEEVQTGSMAKAIESARTLFSFTFPETQAFVQIKEQNVVYGVIPAGSYRKSDCNIEARSDVVVSFSILQDHLISKAFFYWTGLLTILFSFLALASVWITKKISVLAQKRFNLELQAALGLSAEGPRDTRVSRFLDSIVKGVGSGKNLRDSVQNLKEKIIEQNRDAMALREAQLATELELKKNEKFIEVVRQVRHDIRSPLQTLTVLSEQETDSSIVHRQMTSVISSISGMIEDLEIKEEMADSSRDGERLHVAEALIKEVIQQKRLLFGATKLALKINSDFLSVVQVQPHHFRRVIGNILQNAYEAIAPNAPGEISIETEKHGETLTIRICDNGKGIPQEIQDKIFAAGFTHNKKNGSGLGLSHAKSCILRWGGNIKMESVLGEGTTLTISLPIAIKDALFVAQSPLRDIRVNVVVDDDPADFERVRKVLPGAAVYCSNLSDFENWQSAVEDQDGVQLIFDYNLGEARSGLEVLKTVPSRLPRILSTNDYDRQDVIEASLEGIYVLPKVFLA